MNEATWVVIADGTKAHIYNYNGSNQPIQLIKGGKLEHANLLSHELASAPAGRNYNASMVQRTDPQEHEKHVFAHEIADFLKLRADQVSKLVLIAAPKMLGTLRQVLPENVKSKISIEVDKDLTNVPQQELETHLHTLL